MNEVITGISTKFNFIHIANGGGGTGTESTAQTGDFTLMIVLMVLAIALSATIAYIYANKKRFAKINYKLFGAIVLPVLLVGGVVAGVNSANAAEEEFTGNQIDVYVNEAGGPVTYGEGETSNVKVLTNITDDVI